MGLLPGIFRFAFNPSSNSIRQIQVAVVAMDALPPSFFPTRLSPGSVFHPGGVSTPPRTYGKGPRFQVTPRRFRMLPSHSKNNIDSSPPPTRSARWVDAAPPAFFYDQPPFKADSRRTGPDYGRSGSSGFGNVSYITFFFFKAPFFSPPLFF